MLVYQNKSTTFTSDNSNKAVILNLAKMKDARIPALLTAILEHKKIRIQPAANCQHPFRKLKAIPDGIFCEGCKSKVSSSQNIW